MEAIGKVKEIWRYPVKSMGGEKLTCASVAAQGIPGDRGWALRDEKAGEIRGAKKLYQLMLCSAKYLKENRRQRRSPMRKSNSPMDRGFMHRAPRRPGGFQNWSDAG